LQIIEFVLVVADLPRQLVEQSTNVVELSVAARVVDISAPRLRTERGSMSDISTDVVAIVHRLHLLVV
jgi:hypothetical protein